MRRRALRPSFVVTFALGAAAFAGACGGNGDGSAECPAELPTQSAPCHLPYSVSCTYGPCAYGHQTAVCEQGIWELSPCNPPAPPGYEAGPDGEGQDAGHD